MLAQDAGVVLDLAHDRVYGVLDRRSRAHLAVELRQLLLETGDGRDDVVLAPVGLLLIVDVRAELVLCREELSTRHRGLRHGRFCMRQDAQGHVARVDYGLARAFEVLLLEDVRDSEQGIRRRNGDGYLFWL